MDINEKVLKKYPVYGPSANYWTWDHVKTKTFNQKYPRTFEDESEYQYHKRLVREFFPSMEEYIQIAYIDPFERFTFIRNRFKYKTDTDIIHYLLWIRNGTELTESQVEFIIRTKFPKCEYVAWQNDMQHRSVFTVTHYQVFVRVVE